MTRFVRLFSYDPVKDPTARLRIEYDPDFGNAILSDEDVHPEQRDNPDANHIETLYSMQLTVREVRWIAESAAELLVIMERQEAIDQAWVDARRAEVIALPGAAQQPDIPVETDILAGVDQSEPASADGVVLAEAIDVHDEQTAPVATDDRFDHGGGL